MRPRIVSAGDMHTQQLRELVQRQFNLKQMLTAEVNRRKAAQRRGAALHHSEESKGVRANGIPLPPFGWDAERRAILRAELDAYYARPYGLTRKQLRYILAPADLTAREIIEDIPDLWEEVADPLQGYDERRARSDFPGETFRVLKEKEIRQFGEYRTRRRVLTAWAQMV